MTVAPFYQFVNNAGSHHYHTDIAAVAFVANVMPTGPAANLLCVINAVSLHCRIDRAYAAIAGGRTASYPDAASRHRRICSSCLITNSGLR